MRYRLSLADVIFNSVNGILMVLLAIVTIYPLLYVLFASVSDPAGLMQHRGILLAPRGWTLNAYKLVFSNPMIAVGYRNTLLYVTAGTSLNLLLTCLAAYALSRKGVLFSRPLMFLIVFTMFFSGGLIPTYLWLGRDLDMIDKPWALIIPPAISTFNFLILRTAFQSVPVALEESARMDGANDFHILFRIIIPLSLPAIAVIVLYYAVYHWNAFFNALVYLRTRDLYPLQLILRDILISNTTDSMSIGSWSGDSMPIGETIKYATIIVATVPILFIYPFLQRYFVKGAMIGAIKE